MNFTSCSLVSPNLNRESMFPSAPAELRPFTSDYCSEFPEGTTAIPMLWADCCFSHDLHYWVGGTEKERSESDFVLKKCVNNAGASFDSFLMYTGVRMGGLPGDASYSWGYGWTATRDYLPLPAGVLEKSKELLKKSEYYQNNNTRNLIDVFINALRKKLDDPGDESFIQTIRGVGYRVNDYT